MAILYTIGHSTRSFDELVEALRAHRIERLVDIRSFLMSRRLPQFNRENLERELPRQGIEYVWMKELGGRRKKIRDDSPNTALRSDSFRNYADYMLTAEFRTTAWQAFRAAFPRAAKRRASSSKSGRTSSQPGATVSSGMRIRRIPWPFAASATI